MPSGASAKEHLAAGGGIESAEQVQQGGFAAAAGSADGDEFAGSDGEVDAAQRFDAAFVVALVQAAAHFEDAG